MIKNLSISSILFFYVFFAIGCVNLKLDHKFVVDDEDWVAEGGDQARHHATATVVDPPLVEKWRYDVGAGVGLAGALVIDGVILVGTRKGQIHALDLNDGKRVGRARFEAPIEGGMTYGNSLLYLPFIDKKKTIIAYNIYKGDQVWRISGAPVETSVYAGDSVAVIVDSDAIAKGVDPRNGDLLWEREIAKGTGIVASPVEDNGRLILAVENGSIHKVETKTGKDVWVVEMGQPLYSTPSINDKSLFVPTTRGRLYSLSLKKGEEEWVYALADSTVRFTSPGYDSSGNKQLVVATSDGKVHSLDPSNGKLNWITSLDGAIITAPLFTSNTIYVGTLRGKLYALDKITGDVIWEHKVTGRIKSAIIAQDNKLVVLAETQQLFVFEPENASETSL